MPQRAEELASALGEESPLLERSQWDRYNDKAQRLLQGRSSAPDGPEIIYIGQMIDVVKAQLVSAVEASGEEEKARQVASFFDEVYADPSDGTHPTMWGLVAHIKFRRDGTGVDWQRKAELSEAGGLLFDLEFSLSYVVNACRDLLAAAEEIREAFSRGPGADPNLRRQTVELLQQVLANPPEMEPEARKLLERRGAELLKYYRSKEEVGPQADSTACENDS